MTAPSLHALAQRLSAVETRLSEIENGYGATMYRMERRMVRTELMVERIISHLGLTPVSAAEVDGILDEG